MVAGLLCGEGENVVAVFFFLVDALKEFFLTAVRFGERRMR